MLDSLWAWSSENNVDSRVLWLHGPAGAGKSAVAQSFCERLEADGRLGGSFFFKRGHPSRGNARKLFPTIAYQLALLPELNREISKRIEKDPSIITRALSTQFHKLVIKPCHQSRHNRTLVIVIDGLDECDNHQVQQEILRALDSAVHRNPLPFRILITSRPEPHIQETFKGPLRQFHRPLNIRQAFEDVRKYLQDEFGRIHREHHDTMGAVPSPWPSRRILNKLVDKSSGYFIYASTVIKFIDDKYFRPTERLAIVVGLIAVPDSESPYGPLDQLYTQILSGVRPTARPRLLKILSLGFAMESTSRQRITLTLHDIEELLKVEPGDVRLALRGLHSVIRIPSESNGQLFSHHASFIDFLKDPKRSGTFYVGGPRHIEVACQMLEEFSGKLGDPSCKDRAIW
ncbi:hypothetical protein B0H14DRAFT_2401723 [Mycena olivaceomarginata]|nr:hypothetical protein B0H14DRAFT_2401723 [Mycena olivaceomarginata]